MSKRCKWSTLDYDTRIGLLEFQVTSLQAELVKYKKCAENHLKAELDKHRWI